jgi:hypothetical protein
MADYINNFEDGVQGFTGSRMVNPHFRENNAKTGLLDLRGGIPYPMNH